VVQRGQKFVVLKKTQPQNLFISSDTLKIGSKSVHRFFCYPAYTQTNW